MMKEPHMNKSTKEAPSGKGGGGIYPQEVASGTFRMSESTKEWDWSDEFDEKFGVPITEPMKVQMSGSGKTLLVHVKELKSFITSLLAKQKEEWVEMCEEMKQAEENPNDDPYYSISDAMVYNQALSDLLAKLRE